MKKAWIVDGVVVDLAAGDPQELFHPDVAKNFSTDVDDEVQVGAVLTNGAWVNPAVPDAGEVPAVVPPTVGPNEFYFLWTMQEQIAIEELRQADPVVKLFMRRLDDVRTTEVVLADPTVQAAVEHTVDALVAAGVIAEGAAAARKAAIIAGPVR